MILVKMNTVAYPRMLELKPCCYNIFISMWKSEYLTSLREFHCTSGNNDCKIAVGDIVLIHDNGPCVRWRLATVEELIYGSDGLV